MTITIRPAVQDDAEGLCALIATMGYQVGAQEVRARLGSLSADHAVFVALSGPEGVGWIHVLISHSLIVGTRAELGGLAVAAEAQGTGAGSALLLSLIHI